MLLYKLRAVAKQYSEWTERAQQQKNYIAL